LNRFDASNQKFKRYLPDPNELNSITSPHISAIYQVENQDGIWIATDRGLNCFDPATERFIHFLNDPKDPNSLSHNGVTSMYQDHTGRFWIGTNGGGLNRLVLSPKPEKATFIHYTQEDGLPNNVIYGILEDEAGMLWLSTNKGLARFNPENKTFRNYDISDGLQSNEFNRNAYYKCQHGEMFFGGIHGVNSFFPHLLQENPDIPPVVITDFKIFNESVPINRNNTVENDLQRSLPKNITEIEEITLSYKDKVFSFEFVALDYTAPEKNQYAYKMEGFDEEWVQAGTKREATYTNLSPGEYTFRVKGSNNDGIWNEDGEALNIIITPPYWQTWWFRILSFIAMAALLFTAHRILTKRHEVRNRALQKEIDERKQAEQEVRRSKILLESSIESPKDMIILSLNREYRYLYFNNTHAESMGHVYGTRPRIGDCIFDFMKSKDDIEQVKAHYDRAMAGESHVAIEEYGEDQARYYYEIQYNPVYNEKKEIIGVTAFAQNITERKAVEVELEKHREHLEDLVRERTKELEDKNAELERYNKLFVGREFRIKELKEKVKELERK
jgi:PAS domain S-box-containing protein